MLRDAGAGSTARRATSSPEEQVVQNRGCVHRPLKFNDDWAVRATVVESQIAIGKPGKAQVGLLLDCAGRPSVRVEVHRLRVHAHHAFTKGRLNGTAGPCGCKLTQSVWLYIEGKPPPLGCPLDASIRISDKDRLPPAREGMQLDFELPEQPQRERAADT